MINSPQIAKTISFGYSDSEDRIWARCVGSNFEERYWLTRSLTKKIITSICEILDQNTSNDSTANINYLLNKSQAIVNTPSPEINIKKIAAPKLCHSIDLKISSNSWLIIWKAQDSMTAIETFGLTRDLLYALYIQSLTANWNLLDDSHWLSVTMQQISKSNHQRMPLE